MADTKIENEDIAKAINAFSQNKFDEAETICMDLLKKDDNADANHIIGCLRMREKKFDESRYGKPQYVIDKERAMAAANQTLKERNVHTPLISHLGEPVVYKRTPIPENTEILNDFYEKPPKPTKPPIKDDYIKVKKPEEIDICDPLKGHYAWQNCEKIIEILESLEELDDVQNIYTNANLENIKS